jgi:hypothetical protein
VSALQFISARFIYTSGPPAAGRRRSPFHLFHLPADDRPDGRSRPNLKTSFNSTGEDISLSVYLSVPLFVTPFCAPLPPARSFLGGGLFFLLAPTPPPFLFFFSPPCRPTNRASIAPASRIDHARGTRGDRARPTKRIDEIFSPDIP